MDQKGVSGLIKFLAFLPLLLVAGGIWYYASARREEPPPAPAAAQAPAQKAPERTGPPGVPPPPLALEIQGPADFKARVTASLRLIWESDRDSFLFIRDSLGAIRNETRTGFYMEDGRPVAAISRDHAFRSATWCAGIIAHQAWHARHFTQTRKKGVLPPPLPGQKQERRYDANPQLFDYKGLGAILDMEDRAAQYQLSILRKVGAPRSETDPLFRRAPRDFTLSHDGNYSLRP